MADHRTGSPLPAPTSTGPTTGHRIVFTPSGLTGTVEDDTTVLDAARSLGVDLDSVCGGRGICGRCQITPSPGDHPSWSIEATGTELSPPGALEAAYRGRRPVEEGGRLGCGAHIRGNVVIDVPAASQIHRQVVRKEVDVGDLELDPVVTLHYLELPADDDGAPLAARIVATLAADRNLTIDEADGIDPRVLPTLHAAAVDGALTVAVRNGRIVAARRGFIDRPLGVAFDIGSTTIAGHLCDLGTGEILATAGAMNPQIRFGEDLMSRVSYAMLNEGGAEAMTGAVRQAVDDLVGELLAGSGETLHRDDVLEIVAVGNPIMHHLLLGIDPTPLGQAPFPLATAEPVDLAATELGLDTPNASVHVGPCIAGHVGADTTAAILAVGPHRSDAVQLLVDVGTNAEIVLGNHDRLLAASSPTGPAFEGAQITAGQRATVGAIERVRVDRATLEPRFKVIGCDSWSDEPGFATTAPAVTGICGSGIIEVLAELFLAGVIDAQGVLGGEGRSTRIEADGRTFAYRLSESIVITQGDVRAIQLAKAALRAGAELLLEHAGLTAVDEVRLAGAFGAHIDPLHAMVLGLIPDCPVGRVTSVGNAAGAGAVRALLSGAQRREMATTARSVVKIETATEERFQEHFVAALALPHTSAPTPNLAATVDLPSPTGAPAGGRRRRRRRERN